MASPKIKGSAFLFAVTAIDSSEEIRNSIPDHLKHYFDEPLMSTNYYLEKDWYELIEVMFSTRPSTTDNQWEMMGRQGARRDVDELDRRDLEPFALKALKKSGEGLYKKLLRKGDPLRSLKSLNTLWKLYHDQGERIIKEISTGNAIIQIKGYTPPGPKYCDLLTGYHHEWIIMAGAQNSTVIHSKCVLNGASSCEWKCQWKLTPDMEEIVSEIESDEGTIKCPACGWINSTRRTHCSSCKKTLFTSDE